MLPQLARVLFTFRGRLSRLMYVAACIGVLVTFAVLFVFIESTLGRRPTLILYPFIAWSLLALSSKRIHDRGRSPFWLLVGVIPVIGIMWLFFELGLRVGTPGENQYGRDPLEGGDYLTVA